MVRTNLTRIIDSFRNVLKLIEMTFYEVFILTFMMVISHKS